MPIVFVFLISRACFYIRIFYGAYKSSYYYYYYYLENSLKDCQNSPIIRQTNIYHCTSNSLRNLQVHVNTNEHRQRESE